MTEMFKKNRLSLRSWLQGRDFHDALRAMDFAEKLHTGLRKDGETPEFHHQVSIAQFIRTLEPSLLYPEATLITVMVHDVPEDFGVHIDEITRLFRSASLVPLVECATNAVTKTFRGIKKDPPDVFYAIAHDPIASIVKPADRINNQGSMVGVFTQAKQVEYIEETRDWILPSLKEAKRRFPEQTTAYENMKFCLNSQIELIGAIHEAVRIPVEQSPEP